jgi:Asp-tRNA(Asn)/Glu-tRNA(Gln) amidotransferase A subunit family amidase
MLTYIEEKRIMQDPSRLTACDAARAIREGRLHPEALMEACAAQIAAREGTVRAFAWYDAARAMQAAAAARPGALRGLPVGVKDVLDTADMPTEYGSQIWQGWQPRADAACVASARAAGAVIIGKTVTTEFATRKAGATTNPHNAAHTPGGSSSGSAAGVADFFFPLAFATQTGGSVIRPAAYCGVVGYKPSYNLIHRGGMRVMSETLDTIGVMSRSVADCALFVGAVAGIDLGDPNERPSRAPQIGICRSPSWDLAAPETQSLLEHVATVLGRGGAVMSDHVLPAPSDELAAAHAIVMHRESAHALGWERAHARSGLSAGLLNNMESALAKTPGEVARAYEVFAAAQAAFPAGMEDLDFLITPSAPGEAPVGLASTGEHSFNFIWTSLHVPCVTVPAGTGPNELPLGIQIVGRPGSDQATLAWAQWVAAALA